MPPPYSFNAKNLPTGLVIGAALAIFVTYFGDFRVSIWLLICILIICCLASISRITYMLLCIGSSLLAILVAIFVFTPAIKAPLSTLVLEEKPIKADAIVILGGGVYCGSNTPDPSSFSRLIKGLELWQGGYSSSITLSEQSGLLDEAHCPKLSTLLKQQIAALYPNTQPQIFTLHNVTTTRDEAARIKDYAAKLGWKNILLVTSPTHSRRAANLFKSYGLHVVSVPAHDLGFDYALTLPRDRLVALKIVSYEYISRIKYILGLTPER